MIRFLLGVLLGVIIGASIATRLPNIEFDYFQRKADEIIEEKMQQQTEDIKEQIKNEKEEGLRINVKKSLGLKCTVCWKILDKKCERKHCGIS